LFTVPVRPYNTNTERARVIWCSADEPERIAMRKILFVQGGGAGVHDHWDNKLVDSLVRHLGPDFPVTYPRMPNEADPDYGAWKTALCEALTELGAGALLVGHSIGGTFLIHALAEGLSHRRSPDGVFLVAPPFIGEGGWPSEALAPPSNLGARLPEQMPIHLYFGQEDDTVPPSHADLYRNAIPQSVVRRLPGRDHQINNDLTEVAADIRLLS
jgi:predicted alpha/beta hydrolase family esterase